MSKQEKIVCAAVEVNKYGSNGKYLPMVFTGCYYKDIKESYLYRRDISIGAVAYIVDGFITSNNRFVDPVEAMKISVSNDNRIDKSISREMERLKKEIAKLCGKRNRGQLGIELSLNVLQAKYSELERSLNEFRYRDYLLPEDLY